MVWVAVAVVWFAQFQTMPVPEAVWGAAIRDADEVWELRVHVGKLHSPVVSWCALFSPVLPCPALARIPRATHPTR